MSEHRETAAALKAPTIIVVLGVTGDLSRRKLFPALLDLAVQGMLPQRLRIVGFSRREFKPEDFKKYVRDLLTEQSRRHSPEDIERFLDMVSYCQGLFDESVAYVHLGETLATLEKSAFGQCANKLFYLAVPPDIYQMIFRQLAASGITQACEGKTGWARILVEKPFGKDSATAEELDALLGKLFSEEQIFRIDHYLAKEALQNIIMFRFSNALFEPLWNREHIAKVEVRLLEQGDVAGRGAFYDSIGALRDVGQNHLLQMISLVAMEHPIVPDAMHIRMNRATVLKSLSPVVQNIVRGQYEGYGEETGVARNSRTETYFRLTAFVDTDRWRGVPFHLESGKALGESRAEITVFFKPVERCLCPQEGVCHHQNRLTFRIQPDEGITIRFWIKKPGLVPALEEKTLSFNYSESPEAVRLPDAYERLCYDAITGDQTLFASTDEVQAAWHFITPILKAWNDTPLETYQRGSRVPEEKTTH